MGFDREVLLEAGIEEAEAFAAVSSGDNSNILAARVVRETFGVGNVVARIYDPGRADVYERLGIPTVATVRWTTDQVLRKLLPAGSEPLWRDPSGLVTMMEVHLHPSWVGQPISRIEAQAQIRVRAVHPAAGPGAWCLSRARSSRTATCCTPPCPPSGCPEVETILAEPPKPE